MSTSSKTKKNSKTQTKPTTVRKQTTRKANDQLTSRTSKQFPKKRQSEQSSHRCRSPQMIKLMINQLEKELAQKTKMSKTLNEGEFRATTRKITSPKHEKISTRTANSTQFCWKSPPKKKINDTIIESNEKGSSKQLNKSNSQKASMKKKKIVYSSPEPFQTSASNKKLDVKLQTKAKQKKSKKPKGNEFIFLGEDLVKLDNIKLPLFIVQSSRSDLQRSKRLSSKNEKIIEVDERSHYLRHSKLSSFNSVITEKSTAQNVNFIQRSYVDGQEKKTNQQDIVFLNSADNFFNKRKEEENDISIILTKKNIKGPEPTFDINQIIQLNNAVVKIQRWVRELFRKRKLRVQMQKRRQQRIAAAKNQKKIEQNKQTLEAIIPVTTIQAQKLNLSQIQAEILPATLSEKAIPPANTESEYDDILKLRQNAAHIQFKTHQQILKELLGKNKITLLEFNQKLTLIKHNLEKELDDIKSIKEILRKSAQKVEHMMKKTKDDILVVKQITTEETLTQSRICQSGQKQNQQKDEILTSIFGKQDKKEQKPDSDFPHAPFEKKCKGMKVPTFDKDIQDFLDHDQEDENSFLSNENMKALSPTDLQEDICTSKPNKTRRILDDIPQSIQTIEEGTFTEEISQVPIQNATQAQGTQNTFPPIQTANFQELYKRTLFQQQLEYQEQQETKKQIESRISRQLGVIDPQDMLSKSQNTISINTSIVGVHKFLLNFFKFYLYYHKNEFLNYMNMPYGQAIEVRLAKNKLKDSHIALQNWTKTTLYTDDDEEIIYGLKNVIQESVLEDFFQSYYEQTDIEFTEIEKANIELEKIHNKAVFQAFNSALNFFRPYYNIGGAPYLWCSSEKSLTFYCIGEENIQQVYEKTQMKILKTSSYLCGPHIDVPHRNKVQYIKSDEKKEAQSQLNSPFGLIQTNEKKPSNQEKLQAVTNFEQFLCSYTMNFNPTYFANLEDRLKKKQLAEAEEENLEWFGNTFEEGKVSTLLNITEIITEMIFQEQCSVIAMLQSERQKLLYPA